MWFDTILQVVSMSYRILVLVKIYILIYVDLIISVLVFVAITFVVAKVSFSNRL